MFGSINRDELTYNETTSNELYSELIDESGYDVGQMFTSLSLQDILMCCPRSEE